MKGILALTFFSLILSPYSFAKGPDRGAAAVDEKYVDEVKTKEAAIQREKLEGTKSSQMYDQEDRQDRGVQKSIERQEERQDDLYKMNRGTLW